MVKKKNTKASRGLAEDKNPRQNIKIYSDAYFDNAINFLQDIFYTFDLKGRFIRWNKSFSVISGYNDKEISLMKPGDFFRGADVRRVMAAIEKTYKEGEYKVEAEFVTKEGKHIPCEFTGTALKDSAGNIIGLCGSGRNLAERKKVEETLRESEHLLATTFKSIGDAVIAADIVGCVVRMNRVAEHLTGWTLSEAAGRPLADVFHIINQHTRQRVENPVAKVLETGQVQGLANDTMLVSRQGVECIIADSAAAIMDDQTGQAIGVVLVFRDQTKEHAAAEELRESRQRFQGLVETLYDWVWEVDPQGHYTYISPRIRDILGYEPEGLLGKTPFDLMPTEEAQRVSKIFGPLVAEQKPIIALENINLHKDGHPVFLETSGLPFYDVHGKFKGYRGTDRDITERKRTEKALRESERSLAITFSSIGDAVIATDAQDRIVRMNQIAEQLTGWPLKEALGRPLNEVFHIINQHTRLPVENPVGKVLETGKIQGLANDTVLVSRQGVERVIADSAAAIVDDEIRQTVGVVLVFRDQTREYAMQAALLESEARYKALFTSAAEGILVADLETKQFSYANPPACRMFGYTEKEFSRIGVTDIHPKESLDHVLSEFEAQVRGEKTLTQLPCLCKNGTLFYANITATPMVIGGHKCNVGFFTDITEHKLMQEKLLVSEKLAVMGRMVADVSHELNNPLAIIAGNTSLLEKMTKGQATTIPDSENAKRFEKIQKAINRCKIIMASLLVSTRPTILDIKPTDMNKIIEESLESMDDRLKSQNVKVVKAFTPRLPIIKADGHRLGQVFINMFSNACDAMPEGGELRIATKLHTPKASMHGKATGKESPAIEIEISDTGEGIHKEDLSKIFDPFVTTKMDGKGVGLGLPISAGIVKEHGGSISVTSKKGEGATFTISLPARRKQAGNKNE